MATEKVIVNFRASKPNGDKVAYQEFVEPILNCAGKASYEIRKSQKKWQAAGFDFFQLSYNEVDDEFEGELDRKFLELAEWLSKIDSLIIENMSNMKIVLNISAWITADQFDLKVPSALLNQIGRLGIDIKICSNT